MFCWSGRGHTNIRESSVAIPTQAPEFIPGFLSMIQYTKWRRSLTAYIYWYPFDIDKEPESDLTCKKSLEIPKRSSQSVNRRRTDNTMAKHCLRM
jgi:hypothetical protein